MSSRIRRTQAGLATAIIFLAVVSVPPQAEGDQSISVSLSSARLVSQGPFGAPLEYWMGPEGGGLYFARRDPLIVSPMGFTVAFYPEDATPGPSTMCYLAPEGVAQCRGFRLPLSVKKAYAAGNRIILWGQDDALYVFSPETKAVRAIGNKDDLGENGQFVQGNCGDAFLVAKGILSRVDASLLDTCEDLPSACIPIIEGVSTAPCDVQAGKGIFVLRDVKSTTYEIFSSGDNKRRSISLKMILDWMNRQTPHMYMSVGASSVAVLPDDARNKVWFVVRGIDDLRFVSYDLEMEAFGLITIRAHVDTFFMHNGTVFCQNLGEAVVTGSGKIQVIDVVHAVVTHTVELGEKRMQCMSSTAGRAAWVVDKYDCSLLNSEGVAKLDLGGSSMARMSWITAGGMRINIGSDAHGTWVEDLNGRLVRVGAKTDRLYASACSSDGSTIAVVLWNPWGLTFVCLSATNLVPTWQGTAHVSIPYEINPRCWVTPNFLVLMVYWNSRHLIVVDRRSGKVTRLSNETEKEISVFNLVAVSSTGAAFADRESIWTVGVCPYEIIDPEHAAEAGPYDVKQGAYAFPWKSSLAMAAPDLCRAWECRLPEDSGKLKYVLGSIVKDGRIFVSYGAASVDERTARKLIVEIDPVSMSVRRTYALDFFMPRVFSFSDDFTSLYLLTMDKRGLLALPLPPEEKGMEN